MIESSGQVYEYCRVAGRLSPGGDEFTAAFTGVGLLRSGKRVPTVVVGCLLRAELARAAGEGLMYVYVHRSLC